MSLACAKAAAVLSVAYAGINGYQFSARFGDVRDKARQFAAIAAGAGTGRLRLVRATFYLAAPLLYLGMLLCAGLPGIFLIVAGVKFWISSFLGLRTEQRILRGADYRPRDHVYNRVDAALNIALSVAAVVLVLRKWY